MDFEGRDVWIGAFVVLTAAAVLGALFAVNQGRMLQKRYHVEIVLPSIAGIDRGTEVIYRGYKVGEVDAVKVDYEPDVLFNVSLALQREVRLRRGTTVLVRGKGLGGARYLELAPPAAGGSQRFIQDGDQLSTQSEDDLLASAQNAMGDVQRLVGDLEKGGTAANIQAASGQAKIAMADLTVTLRNLNALVSEDRADLSTALKDTGALTGDLDKIIVKKGPAIEQTLDNLNEAASHLPAIMKNVEALTTDLKAHPWKLVRK